MVGLLSSTTSTVSVEKPTAVFIETHLEDQVSLFDYWHAAVSFGRIGFRAHLLSPYTGVNVVHPDNLTDFVAVLLITPRDALRFGNDIEMLTKYVAEGNGLIIAGQSGSSEYEPWARRSVNEMTSKFGIEFQSDMVCDPERPFMSDPRYPHWPMVTRFSDDELSEGVARISYHSGCSLKLSGNATPVAWTSDQAWSDLDGDKELGDEEMAGQRVVAAVSTYGKGRIACIGDNNLWSSRFLDGFDNNRFLLNLLRWVSREAEEPDVEAIVLDLSPEASLEEDGNYSSYVPIRVWNQGTAGVQNLTIYLSSGDVELAGGNLTYESLEAGDVIEASLPVRFSGPGCKDMVIAYEFYVSGQRQSKVFRSIKLFVDFNLYHIASIFQNQTEIAFPAPGGLGNFTAEEIGIWANTTRDLILWDTDVLNHTDVSSKAGTRYSINSGHTYRNIIGFGDPESNYVSGYVLQEGDLIIIDNKTAPKLLTPGLPQSASSLEELLTSIPRLEGNLSAWGYLSLFCEENRGDKLAVGGFGRKGTETAMQVLWKILNGEMEQYEDELSVTVALFRGIYNAEGEIVEIKFF